MQDKDVDQLRIQPKIIIEPQRPAPQQHRMEHPGLWFIFGLVVLGVIVFLVMNKKK